MWRYGRLNAEERLVSALPTEEGANYTEELTILQSILWRDRNCHGFSYGMIWRFRSGMSLWAWVSDLIFRFMYHIAITSAAFHQMQPLWDRQEWSLIYYDDTIGGANTWLSFLTRLEAALRRCFFFGIKLRIDKLQLAPETLKYWGAGITKNNIEILDNRGQYFTRLSFPTP